MDYTDAVSTLLDKNAVGSALVVVVCLIVLFLLVGKAVQMWRELFGKDKAGANEEYVKHCQESEKRFLAIEEHIKENHDAIRDLKGGQRASCIAIKALLHHAIHNGNADEMQNASTELDKYLINRK